MRLLLLLFFSVLLTASAAAQLPISSFPYIDSTHTDALYLQAGTSMYRTLPKAVFSSDNSYLAMGDDLDIVLWGIHEQKEIAHFRLPASTHRNTHPGIPDAAFSTVDSLLAIRYGDGSIHVINYRTGREVWHEKSRTQSQEYAFVAFSPDGKWLLTNEAQITLRDARSGEVRRHLPFVGSTTAPLSFGPDESTVFLGDAFGQVHIWDVARSRLARRLAVFTAPIRECDGDLEDDPYLPVTTLALSPDGSLLVAGSAESNGISLWDVQSGRELWRIFDRGEHCEYFLQVAFSPDGRSVLAVDEYNLGIHVIDVASAEAQWWPMASYPAAFSPDGSLVFSTSDLREGYVWKSATRDQYMEVVSAFETVSMLQFAPSGRRLYAKGYRTAFEWDLDDGTDHQAFVGHRWPINTLSLDTTHRRLLTGSEDGTLNLWSLSDGTLLHTFTGVRSGCFIAVEGCPIRKSMICGRGDRIVASDDTYGMMWDAHTYQFLRLFAVEESYEEKRNPGYRSYPGYVDDILCSPDGRYVITGYNGSTTAHIWDAETGAVEYKVGGLFKPPYSYTFRGPHHLEVATRNWSKYLDLSAQSVDRMDRTPPLPRRVSMNGQFALWVNNYKDHDARILRSRVELRTSPADSLIAAYDLPWVQGASVSADGTLIAFSDLHEQVVLLEASTGHLVGRLLHFMDGSWAVVSSDGRYDVSTGEGLGGLYGLQDLRPLPLSVSHPERFEPGLLAELLKALP